MTKKLLSAAGVLTLPILAFICAVAATVLLVSRTPDDPSIIGVFFFLCALVAGLLTASLSQLIDRPGPAALPVARAASLGLPVAAYVLLLLVLQGTRMLGPLTIVTGFAIVVLTEYVIWPRTSR